jgi:hypothetical protein
MSPRKSENVQGAANYLFTFYLIVIYLTMLSVTQTIQCQIIELYE